MNEFFIVNDRRGMLSDKDLSIEVHQLKMHNFDIWIQSAEPIKQALQNKDHSDEILFDVMKTHLLKITMLCALATEQDIQYLFEIAQSLFLVCILKVPPKKPNDLLAWHKTQCVFCNLQNIPVVFGWFYMLAFRRKYFQLHLVPFL